jgi:nucleoside-diphosphate-sugar epimerase
MRLLVLGGTAFVGGAVAAEAVVRGHDVTCAARGKSGSVPYGATHVPIDRDQPDGLAPLAGSAFDAVVDVAPISYPWVADALRLLAPGAGHWTFVSTVNVYADNETPGQRPDAPLLEPLRDSVPDDERRSIDPNRYGGIKVASENAVRETMDGRAFVVRPGLITGPGDRSDRFGYWPGRLSRGGRAVVPDSPDQPIQIIDVRDLAEWIVTAGERRTTGTYDGVGPVGRLGDLLGRIAGLAGGGAELVPVAPEKLTELGVNHYGGPQSLPLWLPPSHWGMKSHDPEPSLAAGLRVRPLADTVAGALATERELGLDRPRRSGLSADEEASILASVQRVPGGDPA